MRVGRRPFVHAYDGSPLLGVFAWSLRGTRVAIAFIRCPAASRAGSGPRVQGNANAQLARIPISDGAAGTNRSLKLVQLERREDSVETRTRHASSDNDQRCRGRDGRPSLATGERRGACSSIADVHEGYRADSAAVVSELSWVTFCSPR